ncbi:MAG: SDR family NAD(P)-dependent oxidoreductase [Bryobacteraceae bacterium]|jgi:NADP-dependent 3-hydroxy acid dehydrogenase YdfG
MPVSLKNQVALVIGASSGIGRATAIQLARDGALVMASARRIERLRELQDALAAEGFRVEVHAADARDAAAMEELAEATRRTLGPIDILVYATGTNTPDRAFRRLRPPIWDELIRTNLDGAYYAAYAVLPAMRERGRGHLVFISSISGQAPDVSGAAYQASKRGMIGLAHAIRLEEKENGIRTTVVCPGLVDTELLEKRPFKTSAEQLAVALLPEHVAEAVLACLKLPPRAVIPELTIVPSAL